MEPIDTTPVDPSALDSPLDRAPEQECLRCGKTAPMRFRGLCQACRAELVERFPRDAREIAVAEYEPKMNVTPNAVALKDD